MDWKECIRKLEVKQISPDREMADSLRKTAFNKLKASKELKFKEENLAAKISLSYDAVRELIESIALNKGFKIYNHVCYTYLLKEVMNQQELAEDFDELRKIRNSINYYGKQVSAREAADILYRIDKLFDNFLNIRENK